MGKYDTGSYGELLEQMDGLLHGSPWSFRVYDLNDADVGFIFEAWSPAGEDLPYEGSLVNLPRDGRGAYEVAPEDALAYCAKFMRIEADGFDVDEHVELWIDGRGRNGVPGTVRELLDDAEEIQKMLNELAETLEGALS